MTSNAPVFGQVKALAEYNFPSRSRRELYGDDQLVSVTWSGNTMFCAAGMFRVPLAMSWGDFVENVVGPWAASDPAYQPDADWTWSLEGEEFEPDPAKTLPEQGIGHKYTLAMASSTTEGAGADE